MPQKYLKVEQVSGSTGNVVGGGGGGSAKIQMMFPFLFFALVFLEICVSE